MKRILLLVFGLVLVVSANASKSMDFPPTQLDRAKLEEILKQGDHASVSFALASPRMELGKVVCPVPATHSSVDTDDKVWLAELAKFLSSVDGKAEHLTAAIATDLSMVRLFHGNEVLLNLFWVDDEKLVLYAKDWTVELQVDRAVLTQYLALCAKKKPAIEIERKQKQQLKVPLPGLDPKGPIITRPTQPPPKPAPAPGPRT